MLRLMDVYADDRNVYIQPPRGPALFLSADGESGETFYVPSGPPLVRRDAELEQEAFNHGCHIGATSTREAVLKWAATQPDPQKLTDELKKVLK